MTAMWQYFKESRQLLKRNQAEKHTVNKVPAQRKFFERLRFGDIVRRD